MKNISFGIDVGIASVGWAVIDEKDKIIIERGSRLFATVDDPKDSKLLNETRREKRSIRRQQSRRKTRKRDFIKFLIINNFVEGKLDDKNLFVGDFIKNYINDKNYEISKDHQLDGIYQLRLKGIIKPISFNEQLKVLFYYLSKRGFTYDVTTSEKDMKEITKLREKNKDLLPIQSQIKYYQEHGFLKGAFNRSINNDDWQKELKQFFEIQKMNSILKDKFNEIYNYRRTFEEGPSAGNINAQSNYGIYRWEDGQAVKKYENIWAATTGLCSIYNGKNGMEKEFRAIKELHSSELFNLLNDLNNMTFNGEKLTELEKIKIIDSLAGFSFKDQKYKKNSFSFKKMAKMLNNDFDENAFKGFRIDKTNKPQITRLNTFHDINKVYLTNNLKALDWKKDLILLDQTVELLSKSKVVAKRKEMLLKKDQNVKLAIGLANIKENYSDTHGLSKRAINEMIPILLKENINQMQIIYQKYGQKISKYEFKENQKYVPISWIEDGVGSPTVRRSLKQTIYIINALIKKYSNKEQYNVQNIFVEMTRESNNKSKRDSETNRQKYREQKRDQIKDQIKALGFHPTGKLVEKIWLYEQQDGKDAYTGQALIMKKIISDPNYVDVDHIIPHSQSFDNSKSNKVLTLQSINHLKGKKTPKQFLSEKDFMKMLGKWAEWTGGGGVHLETKKKVFRDEKKFDFLVTDVDFKNPENQIGFIGRNLTDTSYVASALYQVLEEFFKFKKMDINVRAINGKMTSFTRFALINKKTGDFLHRPANLDPKKFESIDEKGKKSRLWHGHHSEDAAIVAMIGLYNYKLQKYIEKATSAPWLLKNPLQKNASKYIEKISAHFENKIDYKHILDELNRTVDDVKFSRMKNKKWNGQFFNESLYSAKKINQNEVIQISKKNLLEMKKVDCEKYFNPLSKYSNNVLLKTGDPVTYNQLVAIYNSFSDKTEPFKAALSSANEKLEKPEYLIYVISPKKGAKISIKNIKVKGSTKKIKTIQTISQNNLSFYDTFMWLKLEIFKNAAGKYVIVPLTIKMIHFPLEKELKYKDYYYQYLKENNVTALKPIWTFDRGQSFIDQVENVYYLVGCDYRHAKLELKPLNVVDKKQTEYTVNTKLKNWNLVDVDLLGNIFVGEKI